MSGRVNLRSLIPLFITFCFAIAFFTAVFQFDNKYITHNTPAQDGQPEFAPQSIKDITFLADGWELYPGVILQPNEVLYSKISPIKTFAGEYLNLSQLNEDKSPYGISTWRLHFRYDGTLQTAALFLPEVFCAFRLYANGNLVAERGSLEPYKPFVQDASVSFPLRSENELVLQTANYTHYYSGLTYPPIIGSLQAIEAFIGSRILFYGFLCFGTLIAALFSIALWLGLKQSRDRLAFVFGILALAFSAFTAHVFIWFYGSSVIRPFYALEDAMFALIVWCAINICLRVCGFFHSRLGQAALRIAMGFLILSIIVPLFILPVLPAFAMLYGKIITVYRLISALFLLALAIYGGVRKNTDAVWMLCGAAFYGTGILFSAVTVSTFEPAQFAWMEEYAAFALVVCFGIMVVRRSYAMVAENLRLTNHLREEVDAQTREISIMIREREDLISKFLHDMKSPSAFMTSYVEMVRRNNVRLDDQTKKHLAVIEEKCGAINKQIRIVQQYAAENPLLTPHSKLDLTEFLREFYRFNRPDVELDGQTFILRISSESPCLINADPEKLSRLLQNLIYNAVSFTSANGRITLSLTRDEYNVRIKVFDTGAGIMPDNIPRIFDRFFTTRTEEGGTGMGLYIVRTIAQEHGGEVYVRSKPGRGTVFTVRLPLA